MSRPPASLQGGMWVLLGVLYLLARVAGDNLITITGPTAFTGNIPKWTFVAMRCSVSSSVVVTGASLVVASISGNPVASLVITSGLPLAVTNSWNGTLSASARYGNNLHFR